MAKRSVRILHDRKDLGPRQVPPPPTMSREKFMEEVRRVARGGEVTDEQKNELRAAARALGRESDTGHGNGHPPLVYYMRVGNRIKIGYTENLPGRLKALAPEELLATEPGGAALERRRHREFAEYHVAREWFTQGPLLLDHIMRLHAAQN